MQALALTTVAALVAVLGAGGAAGAASGIVPYISGGAVRENGDLKFIVEVIEASSIGGLLPTHRAAGVLLSSRHVLTTKLAADKPGILKERYVLVGRSKGDKGEKKDIKERIPSDDGLLLLLELKEEVTLNSLSRPINLPHQGTDNSGVSAVLAGWGTTGKLKAAALKVLTREECKKQGVKDTDKSLCSADKIIQACEGDEGNPLVQDLGNGVFRLVGLVTRGEDDKKCRSPTEYVDVSKYTKWLLAYIFA